MTDLYKQVNGVRVKLTPAEVEARQAEEAAWQAEQEAKAPAKAVFDQATVAFESLPKGKQILWQPAREAVGEAILAGNFAEAREILETMPVLYEGAEADRAAFLDLFPAE